MTRELSPLFHMGDEVIPDLAVAELVRWGASWQGAAKALAAGESKWYVRSVTMFNQPHNRYVWETPRGGIGDFEHEVLMVGRRVQFDRPVRSSG